MYGLELGCSMRRTGVGAYCVASHRACLYRVTLVITYLLIFSLQCFDTVGWATGRASGALAELGTKSW